MYAGISTLLNPSSSSCRPRFLILKPPKPIFIPTPKFAFPGKFVSRKIVSRENRSWGPDTMRESIGVSCGGDGSSEHAFEQEVLIHDSSAPATSLGWINSTMNNMSKWFMTAVFAAVILVRHDGKGLWVITGSVLNVVLSKTLKRILNQERPASALSSGPGMPSSHAQSSFFAVLVTIMSMVESLGLCSTTIILSGLFVALGSYFSWLRVLLNYHTTSQVAVGAIVGSSFSIFWFWAWDTFVEQAFHSYLWVRIAVLLGAVAFCGGFFLHVYQHWIKNED